MYANKSNHKTVYGFGKGLGMNTGRLEWGYGDGAQHKCGFSCKNSQVNWEKKDVHREASYRTFNDVGHSK